MRKYNMLMLAAAAAVSALVSGCSGSNGGVSSSAVKVPLTILADPAQESADDGAEAGIELLSLENPIDFSYSNYDTDMIFKKKDGTWLDGMESVIPINQERFEAMADQFLHLKAVSKVENPADMEEYELTNPPYSLYITDGEKGIADIRIGKQDENGNYYATLDEKNFYLLGKSTVEALIFDYDSLVLRDSLDINVAAGDLKKVVVNAAGKNTTYKASNKDAMARIAAGLSDLKPDVYASFHASAYELANYGLDEKSRTTFTAEFTDGGTTQSVTVYVGVNADVEDNRRYVQLDGSQMVSYVETRIIKDLLNEAETAAE